MKPTGFDRQPPIAIPIARTKCLCDGGFDGDSMFLGWIIGILTGIIISITLCHLTGVLS